jgi:hypothetical protein
MTAGTSTGAAGASGLPFPEHPGDEAFAVAYSSVDQIGERLAGHYIWTPDIPMDAPGDLYAAFRKTFHLASRPRTGLLHIFAYSRYRLYINGKYVLRGPARFQNNGPQYDTIDVAHHLRPGANLIAVMVYRDTPTGRIMFHVPALTVMLAGEESDGKKFEVVTDTSWMSAVEASYLQRRHCWGSIVEAIDARLMPSDWMLPAFSDLTWAAATVIEADRSASPTPAEQYFAPLMPRSIPLLHEREIPRSRLRFEVTEPSNQVSHPGPSQPVDLSEGSSLEVSIGPVEQAYVLLTLDASEGAKLLAHYHAPENDDGESSYIARAGVQTWMTGDTFAIERFVLNVVTGTVRVLDVRLIAVNYPFERVGRFESSDRELNALWDLSVSSLEVMSEDCYVDCADRERVEWMDNTPPAYQLTRVALAGPSATGHKAWSDPRLHRDMLRRTALTQQADGMIKAHTCSERWDIHAIMLDRACDWVDGVLHYYENTGDLSFAAEMFPFVQRLMNWFLSHRTSLGLVQGDPYYEWVVWGNPMGYQKGEGTCLNAFVYRSLVAAAALATHLGRATDATALTSAANELQTAMNSHLWDATAESYFSGIFAAGVEPIPSTMNGPFHLHLDEQRRAEPTVWAALFALDRGVVPANRRAAVMQYLQANLGQLRPNDVMVYYYLADLLFNEQQPNLALQALNVIRTAWKSMAESRWQTTWENLNAGSRVHIYGAAAAILLSSQVLGVQCDAAALTHRIVVRPHLADLKYASGIVCTELGPVAVAWKRNGAVLEFSVTIPTGAEATIWLPCAATDGAVHINGRTAHATVADGWCSLDVKQGHYEGTVHVEGVA